MTLVVHSGESGIRGENYSQVVCYTFTVYKDMLNLGPVDLKILFIWFFSDRVSLCSLGLPQTCNVDQAGLEFEILLPQPPKCWDCRHVPPCLALWGGDWTLLLELCSPTQLMFIKWIPEEIRWQFQHCRLSVLGQECWEYSIPLAPRQLWSALLLNSDLFKDSIALGL
jgi:hypothetical protein